MKTILKKTIILTTIILSAMSIQAQIKYGVQTRGILNKSSFKTEGDESPEKEWKLGYGIGVFAEIPLKNNFYLRPSLNYQQKGTKMDLDLSIEGASGTQKAEIKLEYIEMPILFVFNLNKWYIGAGPSLGYGISGKAEISQAIEGNTETLYYKPFKKVEDGGLGFNQFDLSLNAIIGLHIFDKGMIQLGYLHGLSNVVNTDEFKDDTFKNRSVILTLGYCFN
ncbi:porin family protein [Mariniflexile gromovii]|uniref:PorT family protein n=1 Tax=Mariniflexile gromovii TaxID=362523 RepID=A0ABS4BTZ5_9FLAO|nr:porin family protein [Mariniflexile gromovii]MBP0904070.1 PorT family protein [Mariniflexile gromovii]